MFVVELLLCLDYRFRPLVETQIVLSLEQQVVVLDFSIVEGVLSEHSALERERLALYIPVLEESPAPLN